MRIVKGLNNINSIYFDINMIQQKDLQLVEDQIILDSKNHNWYIHQNYLKFKY